MIVERDGLREDSFFVTLLMLRSQGERQGVVGSWLVWLQGYR
jgi:hypothetical protein